MSTETLRKLLRVCVMSWMRYHSVPSHQLWILTLSPVTLTKVCRCNLFPPIFIGCFMSGGYLSQLMVVPHVFGAKNSTKNERHNPHYLFHLHASKRFWIQECKASHLCSRAIRLLNFTLSTNCRKQQYYTTHMPKSESILRPMNQNNNCWRCLVVLYRKTQLLPWRKRICAHQKVNKKQYVFFSLFWVYSKSLVARKLKVSELRCICIIGVRSVVSHSRHLCL